MIGASLLTTVVPVVEQTPLLVDPMAQIALLVSIVGFLFWMSELARFRTFFRYLPPIIWTYFIPMLATTFGILPASSPAYD